MARICLPYHVGPNISYLLAPNHKSQIQSESYPNPYQESGRHSPTQPPRLIPTSSTNPNPTVPRPTTKTFLSFSSHPPCPPPLQNLQCRDLHPPPLLRRLDSQPEPNIRIEYQQRTRKSSFDVTQDKLGVDFDIHAWTRGAGENIRREFRKESWEGGKSYEAIRMEEYEEPMKEAVLRLQVARAVE